MARVSTALQRVNFLVWYHRFGMNYVMETHSPHFHPTSKEYRYLINRDGTGSPGHRVKLFTVSAGSPGQASRLDLTRYRVWLLFLISNLNKLLYFFLGCLKIWSAYELRMRHAMRILQTHLCHTVELIIYYVLFRSSMLYCFWSADLLNMSRFSYWSSVNRLMTIYIERVLRVNLLILSGSTYSGFDIWAYNLLWFFVILAPMRRVPRLGFRYRQRQLSPIRFYGGDKHYQLYTLNLPAFIFILAFHICLVNKCLGRSYILRLVWRLNMLCVNILAQFSLSWRFTCLLFMCLVQSTFIIPIINIAKG